MSEFGLYMVQRLTALIMAPLVIGHIAMMIYAVQGGLSAAEILGRTQGSVFWGLFYGLFVLAVSVHAAIGLRVIVFETLAIGGRTLDLLSWIIFLSLLFLGGSAVWAVIAGGVPS
ncbi:MAG: succinate dehydrogenase [Geminicoccaceae bacterium]